MSEAIKMKHQEDDYTWVVVEDDVEKVLVSVGDVVFVLLIKWM